MFMVSLCIPFALVRVGGLQRLWLYLLLIFKLIYTIMSFIMTFSCLYHYILLMFAHSYQIPPFCMLPVSSCKVCCFCFCFDAGSHSVSQASLSLPVLRLHRHEPPKRAQTVNITWWLDNAILIPNVPLSRAPRKLRDIWIGDVCH